MVEAKYENTAVVYARVSDASQRENLNRQADRAVDWAIAQGLHVLEVVKEVGSGVSDTRPKLHKLLKKTSYSTIVVEYKERLTRFGFAWFETLAATSGKRILVMGQREDIIADLTGVIYSFTARMYGQRFAARAKARLAAELHPEETDSGMDIQ
jgi:putative resolvase